MKSLFLDVLDILESDGRKKFDEFSNKYPSTSLKLWIGTLMEEFNSVGAAKQESNCQKVF